MARKKARRNLTFKERALLSVLAVVGIVYITLNFFLEDAQLGLNAATAQFNQKIEQQNVINNEISHRSAYNDRIAELEKNDVILKRRFPSELNQDVILMKLLGFSKTASVNITTYSFGNVSDVGLIEASASQANKEALTEEEKIQQAVNEKASEYTAQVEEDIKKRYEEELGITSDTVEETGMQPLTLEDLVNSASDDSLKTQLAAMDAAVLSQDISISVTADYQHLMQFLSLIEQDQEAIFITNSSYVASTDQIVANFSLRFVGYHDRTTEGEIGITVPEEAGQSGNIFSESGGTLTEADLEAAANDNGDFALIINNYMVNGEKIDMMKRGADNSILYDYSNGVVPLTLRVSGDGDTLNYVYELSGNRFSGTFTPSNSDRIVLNVYSSARKEVSDQVGIRATIVNNTNLPLNITIANEDVEKPRFVIDSLTGKVQVIP
ncbi:hypothetical protein KHM83_14455 [Fusibacter paucivorans]|uniref:Type IV pilus assembly protein PilO n=1 Tax=Fusibacter paucivorans TaxID=76009 RepID=A0ABS5PS23_9FIRM|nr:hypothetical protein [Fusibacter paucivorans]MBS7527883.1 hypothetical protein [Fusibacter paucivorans]